jgi:drug/metabolite transporter (DMT)-like permease
VAAAGVVTLVDPLRASFSAETTLGNVLLVANTAAYGAYIALSRDVFRRYGALTAMTWVFGFGALMTVPFGGFYLARVDWHAVGWVVWLAVAYIILVPTVGAYYLNAWALARVEPSTVAVYIYLQPLIAFALAPLILGERWNPRTWLASLLIFAGVAVVTWRTRSPPVEEVSERPEALSH